MAGVPAMASLSGRPDLNVFDMPELMDGAQSGATNVQREAFQTRCKQVWREDQQMEEKFKHTSRVRKQTVVEGQLNGFLEMFPTIEPALVRSLYYEMGAETCLSHLLVLTETADEATASQVPKLDPKIEIADRTLFPSLTDSNGWEIVYPSMNDDKEESHMWRDRCELVKDFPPAQIWKPTKAPISSSREDRAKKKVRNSVVEDSDSDVLNEVDLRRKCGERRAARKGWGRKRVTPTEQKKEEAS